MKITSLAKATFIVAGCFILTLGSMTSYAGTDFRMGAGIPLSFVLGKASSAIGTGIGGQVVFDFQSERQTSYYVTIDYLHMGGNETNVSSIFSEPIMQTPTVTDWGFSIGASFFPMSRKESVTPVLAAEYGLRFVSEDVTQDDKVSGIKTQWTNTMLFQNLGLLLGAEVQIDRRLSVNGKLRFLLNIPMTAPSESSFVYSNNSLDYLQLQFVAGVQYRLSR